MKLAVLTSAATGRWMSDTILGLAERGHTINVIDFSSDPDTGDYFAHEKLATVLADLRGSIEGVYRIRRHWPSKLWYPWYVARLSRILRDSGAEGLLALSGGYAIMAWISGFKPYAVYCTGSDILMAAGLRRWMTRRVLQDAALVPVNGKYLTEKARELAPRAPLQTVLVGVDCERYTLGDPGLKPVRILCTRGFRPIYNNEYLLHGLAAMNEVPVDFEVAFASMGQGLAAARQWSQDHLPKEISRRVSFLGGVSDERMLELLRSAHVYVSLSLSDGTSISLLEALACGLFPVLSDIPQNREWIDPAKENGLLVQLDRPSILADSLRRALSDDGLRRRAATINRSLVIERADKKVYTEKLSSLLCQMVDENRGAPHAANR